jgi:integrase
VGAVQSELARPVGSPTRARPDEAPEKSIMRVFECQKSIDRAAKPAGAKRITHHDLRHLFATRCIENGVDSPTVSRWLGH